MTASPMNLYPLRGQGLCLSLDNSIFDALYNAGHMIRHSKIIFLGVNESAFTDA